MVSLLYKQAQIHSPRMQLATVIFVSSDLLQSIGYANQIFQVWRELDMLHASTEHKKDYRFTG